MQREEEETLSASLEAVSSLDLLQRNFVSSVCMFTDTHILKNLLSVLFV